jgi:hypothetical protein
MADYPQCFINVLIDLNDGKTWDDIRQRNDFDHITETARRHHGNPRICVPMRPAALQPGQLTVFTYENPDENEPFRIGVVQEYITRCWKVYTFNLKKKRIKGPRGGTGKVVACGPDFRSYNLDYMRAVTVITGKVTADKPVVEVEADIQDIADGVRRVIGGLGRIFGGNKK